MEVTLRSCIATHTIAGICQVLASLCVSLPCCATADDISFTPPSYPLIACDPYFSVWSPRGTVNTGETLHWTSQPHRLGGLLRVDGKAYRLLGGDTYGGVPAEVLSAEITPTRTAFRYRVAEMTATLTFLTPALPHKVELLTRPITYVLISVEATDGDPHEVSFCFSAAGDLAVNRQEQLVNAKVATAKGLKHARIGTVDQPVLRHRGDDIRIEWGYLYLTPDRADATISVGHPREMASQFADEGRVVSGEKELLEVPSGSIAAAATVDLSTDSNVAAQRWLLVAYDDIYSIEYMDRKLRPYWRRNGLDAIGMLKESIRDYQQTLAKCSEFDRELTEDLMSVGGQKYADIAILAFRQCFAAGKFVADSNGQLLQFCKENNSNGCIATSDVFYPMAPQFLLFGPTLGKSFLVPFMEYAASDRWKFPFAPHDLGTYPQANGQVYGGGETSKENQMPVEECGNLLILMAAVAKLDGNASFAERYWPVLKQWADYLVSEGCDPANQLCTDDFAGHMPHNVNLSAKAICGIASFAQLCSIRGEYGQAKKYRKVAEEFAQHWMREADDGDHYRLAFDKPGTWSQKYNLVWDTVLGLQLFPREVFVKEMQYYRSVRNQYGLPLDNRKDYTKLDWILWTATLTGERTDFDALVTPVHKFLNNSPDLEPMTDWYDTKTGRRVGFKARPVVGGVYMPLLQDDAMWTRWTSRDHSPAGDFATLPKPDVITAYVPAADTAPARCRYTTCQPVGDWKALDYDDSDWCVGATGFGTPETPATHVNTPWESSQLWLRRTFDLGDAPVDRLQLHLHHDEDAEVYINGVLAGRFRGYTTGYEQYAIAEEARKSLKPSGNAIAVHVRQTVGGQYIDVGLVTVEPAEQ